MKNTTQHAQARQQPRLKLPVSQQNFLRLREDHRYYVDKTAWMEELLDGVDHLPNEVYLMLRPRRFGKTLNISMFQAFIDIDQSDVYLYEDPDVYDNIVHRSFEGLAISKRPDLYEKFLRKYPVISMSFGSVIGETYGQARQQLCGIIADEAKRHQYLLDSPALSEEDKADFRALIEREKGPDGRPSRKYALTDDDITQSIQILSRLLLQHHKKAPAILIDEYDVPLNCAWQHRYYHASGTSESLCPLITGLMRQSFKYNPRYSMGIVTGCLRISKESMFTGLNNLSVFTVNSVEYNQYFGFTDEELDTMLRYYALTDHKATIQKLYDGYNCCGEMVYTPWDVCRYISAQLAKEKMPAEKQELAKNTSAFWTATGSADFIRDFLSLDAQTAKTRTEFAKLLQGQAVVRQIHDQLTYEDMNLDDMYSIMLYAGFLTAYPSEEKNCYALKIPNNSVKDLIQEKILEWDRMCVAEMQGFATALAQKNIGKATTMIEQFLQKVVHLSVFATKGKKENFYSGVLVTAIANHKEWIVEAGAESGDGYADLLLRHVTRNLGMILELKDSTANTLAETAILARAQIDNKRYETILRQKGCKRILKYGIAFHQRSCVITDQIKIN